MKNKLPISAMVVGRNEGHKLSNCLESLRFCDEIIYGDLNSNDNSVQIAESYNCKIFQFVEYGPSCEYTLSKLVNHINNDWAIMLDPDESISPELEVEISVLFPTLVRNLSIGDVAVPWQFYFGRNQLKGTVWGHKKVKGILFNRHRYEIKPITHFGRKLLDGYTTHYIEPKGGNVLNHYWMDNWPSFLKKHYRYLRDEGRDRYILGERITIVGILYNFFYQFWVCYVSKRGYKDGLLGLFLSFFWTFYRGISNISLYINTITSSK